LKTPLVTAEAALIFPTIPFLMVSKMAAEGAERVGGQPQIEMISVKRCGK
jgi:hypothetical protein